MIKRKLDFYNAELRVMIVWYELAKIIDHRVKVTSFNKRTKTISTTDVITLYAYVRNSSSPWKPFVVSRFFNYFFSYFVKTA